MISAIVISRNEEKNISKTLSSITDPRITEIIVADSNSSDLTRDIVNKIAKNDKRVKLIHYTSSPFTAARGRNEGTKIVDRNNQYLLFLDGDMQFSCDFLDEALRELGQSKNIKAVAGQMHNFYYDTTGQISAKEFSYYRIKDNKPGGAIIVESSAYFQAKGFNSYLVVNEESEFFYRLSKFGYTFKRIDKLMVIHHTEDATNKSKILERLFDRKLTALSKNLLLGLKDSGYMAVLFRENKYTLISSLAYLFSATLLFSLPLLSLTILITCYLYLSLSLKNFRFAFNYMIYGGGLLIGTLIELIHAVISKPSTN